LKLTVEDTAAVCLSSHNGSSATDQKQLTVQQIVQTVLHKSRKRTLLKSLEAVRHSRAFVAAWRANKLKNTPIVYLRLLKTPFTRAAVRRGGDNCVCWRASCKMSTFSRPSLTGGATRRSQAYSWASSCQ